MIKVFAMLVALSPGQAPDNKAAFFTPEGEQLCRVLAANLNAKQLDVTYICEVEHG